MGTGYVEIAVNITLAVDEKLADRARQAAQAMGKSLNQVVREYLEQLAGQSQLDAELEAYRESTANTPGRLGGWKFNRDEINERA